MAAEVAGDLGQGTSVRQALRTQQRSRERAITVNRPVRPTERVLRFRIDARLKIDPAPEPITFDTVLQLGSGEYQVRTQ